MSVAVLLLAAACASPPRFNVDGAACPTARLALPCSCSEAISWAPVRDAEWFEVLRHNPDGSTINVGSTLTHPRAIPGLTPEDDPTSDPITHWLPEWDSDPPRAGRLYSYEIRACARRRPCGAWSGTPVKYAPPPLTCYERGAEVPCYPGDILSH